MAAPELSHSNMDRYYAMWQTLNPDAVYEENEDKLNPIDKHLVPFETAVKGVPWTALMIQRSAAAHVPRCVYPLTNLSRSSLIPLERMNWDTSTPRPWHPIQRENAQ